VLPIEGTIMCCLKQERVGDKKDEGYQSVLHQMLDFLLEHEIDIE